MKRGFTVIEVIIAITILTIGLLSAIHLIGQFIGYSAISNSRLIAGYLAQEGIEIVKNIRDGNYLEGSVWNYNLNTGQYEADYNSTNSLSAYGGNYLNIDSSGLYSYSSGTSTIFQREIEISTSTSGSEGIMYVSSTVSWAEGGRAHEVKVEEKLYNWYQ